MASVKNAPEVGGVSFLLRLWGDRYSAAASNGGAAM
jgi:hypothetical protein